MSIEQSLERIAGALEGMLAYARGEGAPLTTGTDAPTAKKPRRMKDVAIPAQQAADVIPGLDEPVAPDVLADEPGPKTGAELRALAQGYIVAADKIGATEKLVTFIQSVAKIYNPTEPKLIKIADAKVPEAARMIADWCGKNGIKV
jgi:hypothetical protein